MPLVVQYVSLSSYGRKFDIYEYSGVVAWSRVESSTVFLLNSSVISLQNMPHILRTCQDSTIRAHH